MGQLHQSKISPKQKLDLMNLLRVDGQMLTAKAKTRSLLSFTFAQLN
jgi:hypothetical protein